MIDSGASDESIVYAETYRSLINPIPLLESHFLLPSRFELGGKQGVNGILSSHTPFLHEVLTYYFYLQVLVKKRYDFISLYVLVTHTVSSAVNCVPEVQSHSAI